LSALVAAMWLFGAPGVFAQLSVPAPVSAPDDIQRFLTHLEAVVLAGDVVGYLDLVAGNANRTRATDFSRTEILSGASRAVVKERERIPFGSTTEPTGYRIVADVFVEFGDVSRVATWQIDVQKRGDGMQIFDQQRLTSVERLYRLSLDTDRQFTAQNVAVHAEDFDLTFEAGSVFVSSIDAGVTGLVFLGRGDMHFHPQPDTEKTQVRIFCGSETLDAPFTSVFLRIDPGDLQQFIDTNKLVGVTVDSREWKRADDVFKQDYRKSYHLSLGDLSGEPWALLPGSGNLVAEVHTRRYGVLTYARSKNEPEDITVFDRSRHRNIAVYSSAETLARRGRFYNEDDLREYDVVDYNVDLAFSPGRQWLDGVTTVTLRVKAPFITTLTLRLADPLVVRSITSDRFGRLFGFRVNSQNLVVINLPAPVEEDVALKLTFVYGGRLESQSLDSNETILAGQEQSLGDTPEFTAEQTFLYSNRSAWYPQATTTDFATATLKISVPAAYDCLGSGVTDEGWPQIVGSKDDLTERKICAFTAAQPARYLAFLVTKLQHAGAATIDFPDLKKTLKVSIEANPRQAKRGREFVQRVADITKFYASLAGDVPYPTFTLALVENDLPGGHSPAYFAELFQPLPMTTLTWRNDPASFDRFPDFFLAHELAHQWFGQAVGWGNYHEQWLSEAFAQYFAALYAQHQRGDGVFGSVMRQMRRWAMNESDQGPVYLGYRLGHIRNDSRIFRALVYNKGASVLHMLRRLIGDEAFFNGIRRFYAGAKFRKAGTDELQRAFEAEAGRPLGKFFDDWIYGSALPKLKVGYRVDGNTLVVHVEQLAGIFEVPVSFSVEFDDRKKANVVVVVAERTVDARIPLLAPPRSVSINKEEGILADITQ
jgi:hypothetical protein